METTTLKLQNGNMVWEARCIECNCILDTAANGSFVEASARHHVEETGHDTIVGYVIVAKIDINQLADIIDGGPDAIPANPGDIKANTIHYACGSSSADMIAHTGIDVGVGVDLPVKEPTFLDLLRSGEYLDCDLIIGDCDMPASFVWDSDSYISKYGVEHFSSIMYATYERLTNGNIRINCDDDTLGEEFTASAAGYVGIHEYNKLFTKLYGA